MVAGTTDTGWIDPAAIDALEYEVRGDVASVGIQYSYLPSWLSFMVDQARAREAERAMFDAVYRAWSDRPAGDRLKLLFFGVSLGSFSGEAAFSGEADLADRLVDIPSRQSARGHRQLLRRVGVGRRTGRVDAGEGRAAARDHSGRAGPGVSGGVGMV